MHHFVKLLSATPSETLELITSAERFELKKQLRGLEKDEESEKHFVEAALEELQVSQWCNTNLCGRSEIVVWIVKPSLT